MNAKLDKTSFREREKSNKYEENIFNGAPSLVREIACRKCGRLKMQKLHVAACAAQCDIFLHTLWKAKAEDLKLPPITMLCMMMTGGKDGVQITWYYVRRFPLQSIMIELIL